MTQIAQVKKILAPDLAEIAVVRQGACSHNCSDCGGCMTAAQPTVTARAENRVGAREGELVVVETASAQLLGMMAFVYLLPMVLLIGGYLAAQAMGAATGWCILAGVAAFAVSIGLIVGLDRHMKRTKGIQFKITALRHS